MKKTEVKGILLVLTIAIILFIVSTAFYGLLGFTVAWILENGLNSEVNYDVFVYSGLAIGLIKSLIDLLSSIMKTK